MKLKKVKFKKSRHILNSNFSSYDIEKRTLTNVYELVFIIFKLFSVYSKKLFEIYKIYVFIN